MYKIIRFSNPATCNEGYLVIDLGIWVTYILLGGKLNFHSAFSGSAADASNFPGQNYGIPRGLARGSGYGRSAEVAHLKVKSNILEKLFDQPERQDELRKREASGVALVWLGSGLVWSVLFGSVRFPVIRYQIPAMMIYEISSSAMRWQHAKATRLPSTVAPL